MPIRVRVTVGGVALLAGWVTYQQIDRIRRTPAATAPRTEFTVEGLDCPVWCAVRLTESIDGLDGALVESIDQATGRVVVRHDPRRQDQEHLRALFEQRGYPVKNVAARPSGGQPR